jgi:hypothetical protein
MPLQLLDAVNIQAWWQIDAADLSCSRTAMQMALLEEA